MVRLFQSKIEVLKIMEHVIEPGTIETGIVYVQNNCIFYEPKSGRKTKISIAIDDIVLIGEYTINNHPLNKNHLVYGICFQKR